jgi:hypothetical protein
MPNLLQCNTLPNFIAGAFFTRGFIVKKTIAFGFLLSAALSLQAQTVYQVEVIVFANDDPAAASEETWPQPTSLVIPIM